MKALLLQAISHGLKLGSSQVEVFGSRTRVASVSFENGRLNNIEEREDAGVGVRVLRSDCGRISVGSSFTTRTSSDALKTAVAHALALAKNISPIARKFSFEGNTTKRPQIRSQEDPAIVNGNVSEAVALAKSMMEAAKLNPRVRTTTGNITLSYFRGFFRNSLGVEGSYPSTLFQASMSAVAARGNNDASAYDSLCAREISHENAIQLAQKVGDIAVSQLKPKSTKKGIVNVILGPDALQELCTNILAIALRGNMVAKKQSCLRGKFGRSVASEVVNIEDNGTLPALVGSKPFDDEGHEVCHKDIVRKGILVSYLNNLSTVSEDPNGQPGNGIRVSYTDMMKKYMTTPQILPHNLIIKPGKNDLQGLTEDLEAGIFIRSLIGAHTANRVTGRFAVAPQMAYKVRRGEIEYPIKETVLSGSIFELLKGIKSFGQDAVQMLSGSTDSSCYFPSALVEGLIIS